MKGKREKGKFSKTRCNFNVLAAMMNLRTLGNQRNTAVISSADMQRIRQMSRPPVVDNTEEIEKTRLLNTHENTMKVTESWSNSIVNERKARMNRLRQQAEEHEKELQELDNDEKRYQKENRKRILTEAQKKAFQEKPEIRNVHAQLLLHEVTKERQRQILLKERRKELELQRQDRFDEEERKMLKEAEEREKEIARRRREKAIRVAEGFALQKLEAEERKMQRRAEEIEEEELIQQEAARLLEEETLSEIRRKEQISRNNIEQLRNNETLIAFKERQKQIDEIEEERIKQQKIRLDDEMEERQKADIKRRQERQAAIDAMIERQQQTLTEIKTRQQTFDDKQYNLQFEKDQKEVEGIKSKQARLLEERRSDYLDTQKKLEEKRKRNKNRSEFPADEKTQLEEDAGWRLEIQKMQGLKELAEFQKQQALEKKERLNAERERERLEFQHQIELEEQRTLEAQEYARSMLLKTNRH